LVAIFLISSTVQKRKILKERRLSGLDFLNKIPTSIWVVAIGMLLFVPFIGQVHLFDWDEINFAEAAREMIVSHQYAEVQINFEPFWEKPPFFIWLQALSMHYFGVTEWAARFPNAICGVLSLLVIYKIGKRFYDKQFGVIWVGVMISSLLPFVYFKSGIIDPFFNLFIFLGIYFLMNNSYDLELYDSKGRKRYKIRNAVLSGIFIGLAILTKGPVAMLLCLLTLFVFFIWNQFRRILSIGELVVWMVTIGVICGSWVGYEMYERGLWFFKEFYDYQLRLMKTKDAGHGGFLFYHFVIVFIGCFPASIFVFNAFKKDKSENRDQELLRMWMVSLMMVVLIVFTIVKTKIVHYSSLTYLPITFLATLFIYHFIHGAKQWRWFHSIQLSMGIIFWAALLFGIPFLMKDPALLMHLARKDIFVLHNLQAQVYWSWIDYLPFIFFVLAIGSLVFFVWRQQKEVAFYLFFALQSVSILTAITFIIPKAEKYSQAAAIAFFEEKAKEGSIVEVFGYKSYAQLFYNQRQAIDKGFNFNAAIEQSKPNKIYIVCKINKADYFERKYGMQRLYEKNGFVFFEKK